VTGKVNAIKRICPLCFGSEGHTAMTQGRKMSQVRACVKGKGPVLDIVLLHDEHMLRSALQSRKWQLIGMS